MSCNVCIYVLYLCNRSQREFQRTPIHNCDIWMVINSISAYHIKQHEFPADLPLNPGLKNVKPWGGAIVTIVARWWRRSSCQPWELCWETETNLSLADLLVSVWKTIWNMYENDWTCSIAMISGSCLKLTWLAILHHPFETEEPPGEILQWPHHRWLLGEGIIPKNMVSFLFAPTLIWMWHTFRDGSLPAGPFF